MTRALRLSIAHDYRGQPLAPEERAQIALRLEGGALQVDVDAPFHGDPAPPAAPGPTDRLWEYEVSELFIADAGDRYLEIELSPHGHHWVLSLQGVRRIVRSGLPIEYAVRIEGGRYRGSARIDAQWLPPQPARVNAYMIFGQGAARRYCAHAPTLGEAPDFHRLDRFVPLSW